MNRLRVAAPVSSPPGARRPPTSTRHTGSRYLAHVGVAAEERCTGAGLTNDGQASTPQPVIRQ